MPQTPSRETLSSLRATHEAIRVARDVGYPPLEVPPPPGPPVLPVAEVVELYDESDPPVVYVLAEPPPMDLSVPTGLLVFFILCFLAVLVVLCTWGFRGL
jgi:hypothetical protein